MLPIIKIFWPQCWKLPFSIASLQLIWLVVLVNSLVQIVSGQYVPSSSFSTYHFKKPLVFLDNTQLSSIFFLSHCPFLLLFFYIYAHTVHKRLKTNVLQRQQFEQKRMHHKALIGFFSKKVYHNYQNIIL